MKIVRRIAALGIGAGFLVTCLASPSLAQSESNTQSESTTQQENTTQSEGTAQSETTTQSSTETGTATGVQQQRRQRSRVIEETTVRRRTRQVPVQTEMMSERRSVRTGMRRTTRMQRSNRRQYNRGRTQSRRSRAVRAMG